MQYLFLARSLGLSAYSSIKHNKTYDRDYHRITISGELSVIPTLLPRKQAAPRQQVKSVLRTGFSIQSLGRGEYFGFTLAESDGRFLLGDFTITHNTSTIAEACRRLPSGLRIVCVVFAKCNVEDLKSKLPSNVETSTLHSLGLQSWTATLGGPRQKPQVDGDKVSRIIRAEVDKGHIPRYLRYKVAKLVDLARQHGIVPGSVRDGRGGVQLAQSDDFAAGSASQYSRDVATPHSASQPLSAGAAVNGVLPLRGLLPDVDRSWLDLMQRFDVYADSPLEIIRHARSILRTSILWGHRIVDFADMLYLPTLAEGTQWRLDADVVFVDELQDLDELQHRMVMTLTTRCPFVGVGDPMQAIFSFRGAAQDGMERIKRHTAATTLPLSVCYRCPTRHVALAQQICPGVEAAPDAIAGLLEEYDEEGRICCDRPEQHGLGCRCLVVGDAKDVVLRPAFFRPGDVVLSRAKAPMVRVAYWLLKARIPVRIQGRDIGRGLVAFVDSMRCSTVNELLSKVERHTNRLVARAMETEDDAAAEEAIDKRDVIKAVAEVCDGDDVEAFKRELEGLFGDGDDRDAVVTLSTIHRAKGSEADRVWWLDHHKLRDAVRLKHEWQRVEARNLQFVATTRSRQELRLIRSEGLR